MKLPEAKEEFISNWGAFATQWGINKTMAQIHALLMVSAAALTQDDLMLQLGISRGNVNMNIRDLVSWGLVYRKTVTGERKEYFVAEKDIWKVATRIMTERKKRELDPMLKLLEELQQVDGDKNDPEVKAFTETIGGIKKMSMQADKLLTTFARADENWLTANILKLLK